MKAPRRLRRVHAHLSPTREPLAAARQQPQQWAALEFECADAADVGDQLVRMGRGEVPAIVLRGALSEAECKEVLRRLDAAGTFPETFAARLSSLGDRGPPAHTAAVPAVPVLGHAGHPRAASSSADHRDPDAVRWDVGTSLGNLGHEPESFFTDAQRTHRLFNDVLAVPMGERSPLQVMFSALSALSGGAKQAMCAEQEDGRQYGPGIFRSYRPGGAHGAHYDSVRHREQRTNYSVYDFDVQMAGALLSRFLFGPLKNQQGLTGMCSELIAGILLLQSPDRLQDPDAGVTEHFANVGGGAAKVAARGEVSLQDSFIYEIEGVEATRQLQSVAPAGKDPRTLVPEGFRTLAQREQIACAPVRLETGDLYFFKADNVHEVPAFGGDASRVVLATFIGWSESDPRIFVWS